MSVVETPRFLDDVRGLLGDSEREKRVLHLGAFSEAGAIIPESGGVRKLRWALPGRGKSGGARVICYFHSKRMPLFLLAMYAKNERANLSAAERSGMKARLRLLVETYAKE
jgi:hypothetical protein